MKLALFLLAGALLAQDTPAVGPKPEPPKAPPAPITVPESVVTEYFRQAAIAAQAQLAQRDIRDQMIDYCRQKNGGEPQAHTDQQGHQVFECKAGK